MTSRNLNDDDRRPDPDALLKKIKRQDAAANRSRVRIYLGAAPGVGKTGRFLQVYSVKLGKFGTPGISSI
jgi:two-component system sensor histidine kinase KdpD